MIGDRADRADRIKRERDRQEEKIEELRRGLLEGARERAPRTPSLPRLSWHAPQEEKKEEERAKEPQSLLERILTKAEEKSESQEQEKERDEPTGMLSREGAREGRIFRVEYCDTKCPYSNGQVCLVIAPDSISTCARCRYQEIPDHDWVCDGCGREFDRLEKYFEVPTGPYVDEVLEAPEVSPGVRAVPLVCRVKWLCRECYGERG